MQFRKLGMIGPVLVGCTAALGASVGVAKKPVTVCRVEVVEGELNAGEGFEHALGNGIKLWFQPVASGWILRVVPQAGFRGAHDYAELATPPYQSVSPLSISTDFSFRAQDAIGWNPRRFHLATSKDEFTRLDEVYQRYEGAAGKPSFLLEEQLSEEVRKAAEGKLTIVDAKLVPGMADQWKMAAAVSGSFQTTAHTLILPVEGKPSALGKLVWVRFRVEVLLPPGFKAASGEGSAAHACGSL